MSKFKSLIKTYENYEISFLWKFRYQSLLSFTREILDQEIAARGLTEEKMNMIVKGKEFSVPYDPDYYQCLRCTSRRSHIQKVEQFSGHKMTHLDSESYQSNAKTVDVRICSVCGYSAESTEVRDLTLMDFFKGAFRRILGAV